MADGRVESGDGCQCSRAERNRNDKKRELSGRCPGFPPRHQQGKAKLVAVEGHCESWRPNDSSITQDNPAVCPSCQRFIVSYEDQRRAFRFVELPEQLENMLSVRAVEVSRGFVCEQNRWAHHERPGERNSLLLAAGELRGVVGAAIMKTNALQEVFGAGECAVSFVSQHLHR